jgi:hypothetical protein
MKKIKAEDCHSFPTEFTGILEYSSGTKEWWVNGQYHRIDGPAIEYPEGFKIWFLNGSELVPSNIVNLIKNGIYIELLPFLDEETSQVSFSMKWLLADSIIYFPYDFFVRHYLVLQCSETFGEYNKILSQVDIEKIKVKNEFQLKG